MLSKTVTRIPNQSLLTAPQYAPSMHYGKYLFAIQESKYFYSDGEKWNAIALDTEEASPETEASVICGVRSTDGSLAPVKVDADGGLVVAGNAKSVTFNKLSPNTTVAGSKQLLALNETRQYFLFQNLSDTPMYIGIGSNADSSSILVGAGGGGIIFDKVVPTNAIHLYCVTANKTYIAYEA